MNTAEPTTRAAELANSGPPPIHALKFETPPQYSGLNWMLRILEGLGALLIIAVVNLVIFRPITLDASTIALLLVMLALGAWLVACAETIRLLIRMQHDTLRTREYVHYIAWWALTRDRT